MRTARIIRRELCYRITPYLFSLVAAALATASLAGARVMLLSHDLRTDRILAAREKQIENDMATMREQMRKAMLKLTFNLVILPEGQDIREWHINDTGSKTMPEEYVHRLADSGLVSVRHFLPSLQQKITWPEKKRTIILVGSRGEVPNLHKNPVKPMVQPVPEGKAVLGYEVRKSLGLEEGDQIQLLGKSFSVHKCHEQRGSQDDITVWIPLATAQELLDKKGEINAILALECLCVGMSNIGRVRADIQQVLPGTQVLEQGTRALARAEARLKLGKTSRQIMEQEKAARKELRKSVGLYTSAAIVAILVGCMLWMAVLTWQNASERTSEIALWRALGVGAWRILVLILGRSLAAAVPGVLLGVVGGSFLGRWLAVAVDGSGLPLSDTVSLPTPEALGILLLSLFLAAVASWLPAALAASRHPADLLRNG